MMYLVVYYETPRGIRGTKWHEDVVQADYANATGPTLGFYSKGGHNDTADHLVAAYTEWHHFGEMPHD